MSIGEARPSPPAAIEGFWSVAVGGRSHDDPRRRYVCHARGDAHANSMANWIAARTRSSTGYDLVRLERATPEASLLSLGQYVDVTLPG
jgi:hypothetical protein